MTSSWYYFDSCRAVAIWPTVIPDEALASGVAKTSAATILAVLNEGIFIFSESECQQHPMAQFHEMIYNSQTRFFTKISSNWVKYKTTMIFTKTRIYNVLEWIWSNDCDPIVIFVFRYYC